MLAAKGKIYTVTHQGGQYTYGTLFEYNPVTCVFTKKYDFYNITEFPRGALLQASNGKLYGASYSGGNISQGILFDFDQNSYSTLLHFTGSNGSQPIGNMVEINSYTK